MNRLFLTAIALFLSMTLPGKAQNLPVNTIISGLIDGEGLSASVNVYNQNQYPVFCESIDVSLRVSDAEFDRPLGSLNYQFGNIYINPNSSVSQTGIGRNVVSDLRKQPAGAKVSNVNANLNQCHEANFRNYCQFALKSEEEQKTLDTLNRFFGVAQCSDWYAETVEKINLSNSGITNLSPLSFFYNLHELRIGGNPIHSVSPLKNLKYLDRVCIKHTPLAESESLNAPYSYRCE